MGDITGFNMSQVNALSTTVQTVATDISNSIKTNVQQIIDDLSNVWYAQEGVTFIDKFIGEVDKLQPDIQNALNGFCDYAGGVATSWATKTGSEHTYNKTEVSVPLFGLSNSLLTEKNGDEGIIESEAYRVAGGLLTVRNTIKDELTSASNKLKATTAFLGHGQDAAAENCFKSIVKSIDKVFDDLTVGDNSLKQAIKNYSDSYKTSAEKAADLFNNPQSGESSGGGTTR